MKYGWQLNSDVWSRIPQDLYDSRSWRFVDYDKGEAKSVPEGESGVYIFCTSPVGRRRFMEQIEKNDLFSLLFTPIYIGETKNLRERFTYHCNNPNDKLRMARQCFGFSMQFWFHRRSEEQIGIDERALIDCFGPTANSQRGAKRGEPIDLSVGVGVRIGIHDKPNEQ